MGEIMSEKSSTAVVDEIRQSINKVEKAVTDAADRYASKEEVAAVAKSVNEIRGELRVRDRREDDPNCGFKHFGEFAMAVMRAYETPGDLSRVDERLKLLSKAAPTGVSQGYDPSIGFLFPAGFVPGLFTSGSGTQTPNNLLNLTTRIPIDASQESVRLTMVDDLDSSGGTVRGGVVAYWKSEVQQMVGSSPRLYSLELRPEELYSMAYATDKSLRNAPMALGAFLTESLRQAVDWTIGRAIFEGDGVGKPVGILNHPSTITVNPESGQASGTVTEKNLIDMWSRMRDQDRSNAVWLANQDVEVALLRLARSAISYDGSSLESADTPSVYDPIRNTILGRPVVYIDYAYGVGTSGDIVLWAPQHYLVATKAGQGPEPSIHLRFDYAETAFRFIFEIDGKPAFPKVFTPFRGGTTRSTIVKLATR
jgi:HK97 family phage major capsid protein